MTFQDADLIAPLGNFVVLPDEFNPNGVAYTDATNLTQQAADNADSDGDGISEDTDNCRYTANGLSEAFPQSDLGGFLLTDPDGKGDVCQCASADPGLINAADLTALREVLARDDPAADADAIARCSISTDAIEGAGDAQTCNIKDLMTLERALDSGSLASSGGGDVCRRAVPRNLLPDS